MKTINTRLMSALLLLCAFNIQIFAQSDFAEATEEVSKIKARQDFPLEGRPSKNGTGWSTNVTLLDNMPKRVALVTFYLEDPGMSDSKKQSGATATTYTGSLWRTSDALCQSHVEGFYNASIGDLKAGFEKMGMQLLTPDEFLDTQQKKDFYYSFVPQHGGLKKEKTESKGFTQAGILSMARFRAAPEGYNKIWIANESSIITTQSELFVNTNKNDAKFFESMGYYLAEELGVDAVAAVSIITRKLDMNKENYGVNNVSLYMWTKNPIQLSEEEDTGLKGMFYIRGQFLAGSRITYGKPEMFQYQHKKKGYGPDYSGMANAMTALTDKCNDYFEKRLAKK